MGSNDDRRSTYEVTIRDRDTGRERTVYARTNSARAAEVVGKRAGQDANRDEGERWFVNDVRKVR